MTTPTDIKLDFFIGRFSENVKIIESLATNLTDDQSKWKPAPDKWSILEVINHLVDEEIEDFRPRLEKTLNDPLDPWTPIAPQEWVIDRRYNERELTGSLREFMGERDKSIIWLKTISNPNWQNTHHHPLQNISAGDLLASWLAHDLLHIKQLTRLHFDYLNQVASPFITNYAGNWI